MSAEVLRLDDYRVEEAVECDLETAVDVALRDLREILGNWGSDLARTRAEECERLLSRVLASGTVGA